MPNDFIMPESLGSSICPQSHLCVFPAAFHSSPGALDGNGDFCDMKAALVPVKRRFTDAPWRRVCASATAARDLSN